MTQDTISGAKKQRLAYLIHEFLYQDLSRKEFLAKLDEIKKEKDND